MMGKSIINTCPCDLFSVELSSSLSWVNLLTNYLYHLVFLSQRFFDNVKAAGDKLLMNKFIRQNFGGSLTIKKVRS